MRERNGGRDGAVPALPRGPRGDPRDRGGRAVGGVVSGLRVAVGGGRAAGCGVRANLGREPRKGGVPGWR